MPSDGRNPPGTCDPLSHVKLPDTGRLETRMILRVTVRPTARLAESDYVQNAIVRETTTFYVNVGEGMVIENLSWKERERIFSKFATIGLPRSEANVSIDVETWPNGHEAVLRAWLDANI